MNPGQKIAIASMRAYMALLSAVSKQKAAHKAFALFCTPRKRTVKPFTSLFKEAEKLSFSINGITISGFRWNKGGSKRLQVVHGFESASQNFDAYIRAFIDKGYEVLAFDAPAHGISGGKQITLPLYIDILQTIYEQYGPIQSFLAHSFGGLALVHFLETLTPDRSFRLALVAPATESATAIDQLFGILKLGKPVRKIFDDIVLQTSGVTPEYYSISRAITHIHMPVLWIHDSGDTITPLRDVQPLMDKKHPHIQFLLTEGLGHRRIYRDEKVIEAITTFL